MSTTEEETTTEENENVEESSEDSSEESEGWAGTHPIGEILDAWVSWVDENGDGELDIDYDDEEDVFNIDRDGRKAVVFTSDIDEAFYKDSEAIFIESVIGIPPENLDLSQTLKFSGNELVLSRISLSDRHSKTYLLVEAAVPISRFLPANFDLMVREVATIGRDLRKHLAGYLEEDDE